MENSQKMSAFGTRQRVSRRGLVIFTLLFGAWAMMTMGLGCAPRTSPQSANPVPATDPDALDCSMATVAERDLVKELYGRVEGSGHGNMPVVIIPLLRGGTLLLQGGRVVNGTCVNDAGTTITRGDWETAAQLGNWTEWARQGGRTAFAPAGRIAQVLITCQASTDPAACLPPS